MKYRKLTSCEIAQLQSQHCLSEDWGDINVHHNFKADTISHTRFSGEIYLGVFEKKFCLEGGLTKHSGFRHLTLHNCTIGDNCLIENIPNHIANYTIGDNCIIQNVNLIVVDQVSSFGNGVQVSVLNETGGREVPIYDKLSAHTAYILALYRYRPMLVENLQKLINKHVLAKTSNRGSIGNNVRIINTGTIRNVNIDSFTTIDGASRLENGSINSNSYAPVYVGHNVIATDFIFSSGSSISDGAAMVRVFVGQACHLGHLFSAHDSLFFSNCQGENGEACAIFAGPYTVSMHKSSLLIAGMFSFLNAGSGSNQSNHMYKLGPIHQGIVERGSKTTSDSYILWPAKVGAFSLVMGRHVNHPDTSELPFSYLIENAENTYLVPGINLRSVGTIRDTQKWPKRDKRDDPEKFDFINFNLLSPYTVSKMIKGIEVLKSLQNISGLTTAEYSYNNTHIRRSALLKGIELYTKAVDKFFGNSIINRLANLRTGAADQIRELLKPTIDSGTGEWLDISGLIVPKSEIMELVTKLEQRQINDISTVEETFRKLHSNYYEMEWVWAADNMQRWYEIDFETITSAQVEHIVLRWKDAVVSIDRMLYEDARKEFSLSARVGFGVDGRQERQKSDFEQVRGSFNDNPFVISVLKHIETKSKLGDDIIARLRR